MKKAVDVIVIDKQNKILVLKRSFAEPHYPGLWDMPGGGIKKGESMKEAAGREVREEAGLNVKIEDDCFYVFRCDSGSKIEIFGFKANLVGGEILLSKEHTEFKWVSEAEYKNFRYTPGVTAIINEFFKNKD